jgi:hypothetical protein
MATLANIFNRFSDAGSLVETAPQVISTTGSDAFRLRAMPNEDVYFYIKRIDNSRVVREADPQASARSWKFLGGAGFAALLLIGTLLPSAYGLMAGYQLHRLQVQHQQLVTERATLEMEEARLVSTERLQELAKDDFIPPTPEKVIYLTPKDDKSLALNRR